MKNNLSVLFTSLLGGLFLQMCIYFIWFFIWIYNNLTAGEIYLFRFKVATINRINDSFSVDVNYEVSFYFRIACSVILFISLYKFKKN